MPYLSTKNIKKEFGGVHAIDGLSISFEIGALTGIVGPNGSGKTTLINVLSGVYELSGGLVVIGGVEKDSFKKHNVLEYGITRTFQNVRLFEQMPVIDNVLVVLTERNVFGSLFESHGEFHLNEAERVLKRVGLWEKRNDLAVNLSYGQRKLLEVARALATDAELYLFDEPYAGMFPEMVKVVSSIMKELRDSGKTVVLIEHNMELIRELCDHLIVMDAGKLLAEGEPNKVLAQRDVIEAYLGE